MPDDRPQPTATPPPIPRWLKLLLTVGLIVVLVVVVVTFVLGVNHGPAIHGG